VKCAVQRGTVAAAESAALAPEFSREGTPQLQFQLDGIAVRSESADKFKGLVRQASCHISD
jgi:hypothetical protein